MNVTQNLPDLVSIGITTKNRWKDLEITLAKIKEMGLGSLPIILFDDASDQTCTFDIASLSLQIQFERFTKSKGLIVRRNQIAQSIQTKYYLSLDDDSYPVAGSLQSAVDFAESQEDLLCLSFPIYNPVLGEYQNKSSDKKPYQVRSFIGCGHLLNLEHFLSLGGYREELVHQGEEMDIAARGFQKGLFCYHYPDLLIHHTASNQGRNWDRMDFYGSRNNIFWNDWFVPSELKLYKQLRTSISRIGLSLKVSRLGLIKGELSAFRDISQYKQNRQNMSLDTYRKWTKLHFS